MSDDSRLRVVLCWHMHQPQYRDLLSSTYSLHWTYLHAIKDYVDMAAHLEEEPGACAVVNFAPILLEQLDDYAQQLRAYLASGAPIRDGLLAALARDPVAPSSEDRLSLIHACLRSNEHRMIDRFPSYRRLAELGRWLIHRPQDLSYLDESFFADLVAWYHLAWLGETVRRSDRRVQELLEQGSGFSVAQRRTLLIIIAELISGVLERYRRLAASGRVELSVTPYGHPILPLLLDFTTAREAMPEAPLPQASSYPGGLERARWHLAEGLRSFEQHFGFRPQGCWPSEGAVSVASLKLLEEAGFRWAASGGNVLRNSHPAGRTDPAVAEFDPNRPYRVAGGQVTCFFRDDGLSDLIGFRYADWHADDAVADLIHHLEKIDQHREQPGGVVSIIMDGENAWEHYPENGYYFLSALYRRLAQHPRLTLTTFSRVLEEFPSPSRLARLVTGSWVYGTLSTWIGERDKNRAWDLLVDAKQAYDEFVAARPDDPQRHAIDQQLAVCEGSDWFWWFGDYNSSSIVSDFEQLYRRHLGNLYRMLGRPLPETLSVPLSRGGGAPSRGGVMLPGSQFNV